MSGALVGAIAGGLAVLVFALLQPARKCPACATPLPKFRKPSSGKQAMWGGWTCPNCKIEIDRKGRERQPD